MESKYHLSRYNYFKKVNNVVVGVSFINKVLFVIEQEKYDLLLLYKDNLELLKEQNLPFYNAMWKLGIITTLDDDRSFYENALLKRRLVVFRDSNYRLTINPTLNCNFACWYCYETHIKKSMSEEIYQNVLKFIQRTVLRTDIQTFELDWFGGEPLLYYKKIVQPLTLFAKEICDKENKYFTCGITTNGYLINKEMIDFFRNVNMQSFQITLDGSKDFHNKIRYTQDKKGSYDKIIENVILLAEELRPQNLTLRINYTSESFNSILNIAHSFPKDVVSRIKIILQQVWQDEEHNRLSAKDVGDLQFKFHELGFQVEKEILHCGLNTSCYADNINQAVINFDGRVFKCTALDFEKSKEDGILSDDGDIKWNNALAHKIVRATFENEYCRECKYLPVCYGPCHKKATYVFDGDDFKKYCFVKGVEETLDYIMDEFEKIHRPLAPLLEFRN